MIRETVRRVVRVVRTVLTWFMVAAGALVVSFGINRCARGVREMKKAEEAEEAGRARMRRTMERHAEAPRVIQQNAYDYGFSPAATVIRAAGREFRATKLRGVDVLICEDGSIYTVPEPKEDSCKTSTP